MEMAANATVDADLMSSPLVYLSSDLAHQIVLATYLHIGMTAVLVWDIVDNLRNDLRLLLSLKLGIPSFVYFITRYSLLAYSLGRTVLLTAPVNNCNALQQVLNGFLIVFVSFTTLFFYIRVCAIYDRNPYIVAFFGFTWLGTVAMAGTFSKSFSSEHIGPTNYCVERVQGSLLRPAAIVIFVNDVLVYLAITWKVYHTFADSEASVGQRIRYWIFGKSLPVWSRAVLEDSQVYCLIIVLTNGFLIVPTTHLNAPTSTMFIIFHLVLVNILSCRIYRTVRAKLDEWEVRHSSTNHDFDSRGLNGLGAFPSRLDGEAVYGVTSSGTIQYRERAASIKSGISGKSDLVLDVQSTMSAGASIHEREGVNNGGEEKQVAIYVVSRDGAS